MRLIMKRKVSGYKQKDALHPFAERPCSFFTIINLTAFLK
jgi:hypothetical protein